MEAATARVGRPPGRKRRYGSGERRLAAAMLSPSLVVIALVGAYPIGYAIWLFPIALVVPILAKGWVDSISDS